MKKTLIILALLLVAMNAKAQIYYSAGCYKITDGTVAALYKNNEEVYSSHYSNYTSKALKVVCNSKGDVFWMVNHYNNTGNKLIFTEILKNSQVYASTENHDEIHINDIYCLNDTLFYVGYQLNENGVEVATVWKGEDFTPHWILGDSIGNSIIYDAEVDDQTNIPYFCGYVTDSIQKAIVWKERDLLYTYNGTDYYGYDMQYSYAIEISIDGDHIYTLGYGNDWTFIWKDNVIIRDADELEILNCLYAHQGDYYYTYYYPHGWYYAVYKNRNAILELPGYQTGVQRICGNLDDIYMVGVLQGKGCIWKNFEVYLQPNNCDRIYDMVVSNINGNFDEPDDSGFSVYPNPANTVLVVETQCFASQPTTTEYHIINTMGQTILSGRITAETQQINIDSLPAGLYFISVGNVTQKFVVK